MTSILQFWAQLKAVDPRLPYLLTALLCGVLVQVWKTSSPASFAQVPTRVRALPAAAIGAILTAGGTESLSTVLVDLVFGAFAGVTAVGGHETIRRLLDGSQTPPPASIVEESVPPVAEASSPVAAPPPVPPSSDAGAPADEAP